MAPFVTTGSQIKCSFGLAPSVVNASPRPILVEGMPVVAITDIAPGMNIPPFGMCTTQSNPTVAAMTAAALGVPTPAPCVPAIAGPWTPGTATTMGAGVPLVTKPSICTCMWGGVVTVIAPTATRSNGTP